MATADISHVSEEEENYVRMHLLLTCISPRAVRVLFDNEFHPSCLEASIKKEYGKLFDLKKKRVINAEQWKLLFPSGCAPNSTTFDVTLMVALLRHLTKLSPPASGYDNLPLSSNITLTDDLARLKHYRNHLAHFKDGKIQSTFFAASWEEISGAVNRLGGRNMAEECKELRTKHLDQSTVPWNIRVQINQTLDQWRSTNVNFVETRAATQVLKCVQENSCVTITASSGVGKTATLQHVVLKMADEGYDVILVTNPQDIVKFYNPNKKTMFVLDDFCGTYSINQSDINNWKPVINRIKELLQNKLTKIVVACRLQVFKDEKFESLTIFRVKICNLLSKDLCLTQTEKQLIAEMYLDTEAAYIIEYSGLFDCFPLLCKLYHDNQELDITEFFQNPFAVYEAEIEQLKKNGHFGKYCVLALCVMFNNSILEIDLTEDIDSETRTVIENTCVACRLDKGTSRLTLLNELNLLENTFIKKDQGVFKTIHDKLFDFLSHYFGKMIIECLIKNAPCEIIMQRFLLEREDDMDQFVTFVPPRYHQMYIQRMFNDWSNGKVRNVFCNKNMKNPKFRQQYLYHLNTLDKSYQMQLAHTCDFIGKDTVLLRCCFIGDIPLIRWCCDHCVDVNLCIYDGMSPLCVASYNGDTEVVKMLLNNKADINRCTKNIASPLFLACQNNHLDIVKLLLDNKADIHLRMDVGISPFESACYDNHVDIVKLFLDNTADTNNCMNDVIMRIACSFNYIELVKLLLDNKVDINKCSIGEQSPLSIACFSNHVELVTLLLDNKADINKCDNDGKYPLFHACYNNHVGMVKLLLDNKADINKCTDDKSSLLFISCLMNHEEMVQLLLDNKADINKLTHYGASPLFIACHANHVNIVKLLIDNKADINKWINAGTSPLHIACQDGNTDIVKLLLHNKADIDKCMNNEMSPLIIACLINNKEIVQLLLDNKADINVCTHDGESLLLKACRTNDIDMVRLLIDNNADINKCMNDGKSPLYNTCEDGYIDIVKILIDNNADINKCKNDKTSPLLISCMKNHVDIVQMLLDNKADISKCTDNEESPLLIACQKGYKDIVELLLDNKAEINKCMIKDISPLMVACHNNHIDIVKLLLDNKADINKCMNKDISPLFFACRKNQIDIVQLLLDNNADINKCTDNGLSPLFTACQEGNRDIVKLLLDNKADIDKSTDYGFYPLLIACLNNDVDIVKLLLDNKADINKITFCGSSPIFVACYYGHKDIVKILLANGANINTYVRKGNSLYTPQQIASNLEYNDIATLIGEHSKRINFICGIMKHILTRFKQL